MKRAIQLRDIITSLGKPTFLTPDSRRRSGVLSQPDRWCATTSGPFFIKLGQALSIRPDILSPKAMVELQKLCDKVGHTCVLRFPSPDPTLLSR